MTHDADVATVTRAADADAAPAVQPSPSGVRAGHDGVVHVRSVDPRDQTWEVDQPAYRVYFHDAGGLSDEYEVTGVDVTDVIAWAQVQRGERTFVLYAVIAESDGLGLVRLLGQDPHAAGTTVTFSWEATAVATGTPKATSSREAGVADQFDMR